MPTGIKRNLHIVLIMDCTNSNFTLNCESNPAFFKRCAVQWMDSWSRMSMYKVSITSVGATASAFDLPMSHHETLGVASPKKGDNSIIENL